LTAAWIGGWQELLDNARDLGVAVPPRSTRPAQASALGLPTSMARDVDVAVFSPTHPPSAETFWTEVETWRESMKASASPLRRAWALFNPASLLPRRR
jgi:hypothetical protein